MDKIKEFAKAINKIENSNYFIKLKKVPSRESFIESQKGFVYAIDSWSKLLAQLLIMAPSDKERVVIVNNLYDEHGKGDPSQTHVKTFNLFLQSLGYEGELNAEGSYKSSYCAKGFIDRLQDAFKSKDNWLFCVSMMAMIEYTYCTVSKNIHEYACNFLDKKTINHYSLHEIIDEGHANDLFKLIEPHYSTKESLINSGIIYGYNSFYKLYDDMSQIMLA